MPIRKDSALARVMELSAPEKILVVEELWDSIATHPESVPVTAEQKEEIDSRLADYARDPKKGSSWRQVKRRILSRTSHK